MAEASDPIKRNGKLVVVRVAVNSSSSSKVKINNNNDDSRNNKVVAIKKRNKCKIQEYHVSFLYCFFVWKKIFINGADVVK